MTIMQSFHDVRFPTDLALGAMGGPQRNTEVVTMGSGYEQRNTRWKHSRRRYNVGYGIKTIDDLYRVLEFFEERRGRLFGFRFRDPFDWKSCPPSRGLRATDQRVGVGDGKKMQFPLLKNYGAEATGYERSISHPVLSSIRVAINGRELDRQKYTYDPGERAIVFEVTDVPVPGQQVTAGFEFDVPVRFDMDEITVNLAHFEAGEIPAITLVEILQ